MSRKRKSAENGGHAGVYLVPVLSIVFILLLLFISLARFPQERGLDLGGDWWCFDCGCESPIVIAVDGDNRIFVDGGGTMREVDIRAVRAYVARRLTENPRCPSVLVQAHRDSEMGIVVRVMDEAKQARDRPQVVVSLAVVD